jgi:hypothetical protein
MATIHIGSPLVVLLLCHAVYFSTDRSFVVAYLRTGKEGRRRRIKSATIPTTLDNRYRIIIQHSTARQMERLYSALPYRLQNIRDIRMDTFKKHLDRWLTDIPDNSKIGNYEASVSAEINCMTEQKNNKW